MINVFISILICIVTESSFAYFEQDLNLEKNRIMNGIKITDYTDFLKPSKDWFLVTARYRKDNNEIRLTYANKKAYDNLLLGLNKNDYANGAVFAKVAFKTETDPLFSSSEVPSASKRYQLMIFDSVKYKSTDGWGYALFDANGYRFDEDEKKQILACHACHKIAEANKYIFSDLMPLDFTERGLYKNKVKFIKPTIEWSKKNIGNTNSILKNIFRKNGVKTYWLANSPIKENFFSGTLDEILPTLISKSEELKETTLFQGDDLNFSYAIYKNDKCILTGLVFKGLLRIDEKKCK